MPCVRRSTHMSIAAASVDCDDLRLAYSSVMSQIEVVPDGSMALSSSQDGAPILSGQPKAAPSSSSGTCNHEGIQEGLVRLGGIVSFCSMTCACFV